MEITFKIQGDSKRWTQLKSKRHVNTRRAVGCVIPSSVIALRVDVRGLRSKPSSICLMFSSDTPKNLVLHSSILLSTDAAARLCIRWEF